LEADDAFNGDITNKPELIIETDEQPLATYLANETVNKISSKFGICVINNGIKAISPGIANGFKMGKPRITIPEITLMDKINPNIRLSDDFEQVYNIKARKGLFPVINPLLSDNTFMVGIDVNRLKCGKRGMEQIVSFIHRLKDYEGTVDVQHNKVEVNDYPSLSQIPCVQYAIDIFRRACHNEERNAKLLIKAIRLIALNYRNGEEIKQRIEYSKDYLQEQSYRELFSMLKPTWKNIRIQRDHDKLVLRVGDVQRISNGERDAFTFMARLLSTETKLSKKYNILIIDEVFDYLDDANLMVAQYYITSLIEQFKKEGRFVYPIILSHLNPDYYNQHYSFKDMKVYYLCKLPNPQISNHVLALLRRRKQLAEQAKAAGTAGENISKYMLHYNTDYTVDLTNDIGNTCPTKWSNIQTFKDECMQQLNNYLESKAYDPLSVCVALREIIEHYICSIIESNNDRDKFIEEHGTNRKMAYAEEMGIDVPEIFYLLGNLYNDPMHVDNHSNKNIVQTLYSRMENNIIRGMVRSVKDKYWDM
jgi:hypothetical protein